MATDKPGRRLQREATRDVFCRAVEQRHGPGDPEQNRRLALQWQPWQSKVSRELDRLPVPTPEQLVTGQYKGMKVYARDNRDRYGRANGTSYPCQKKGCTGDRIVVYWPDGRVTYPCVRGIAPYRDGWRIT